MIVIALVCVYAVFGRLLPGAAGETSSVPSMAKRYATLSLGKDKVSLWEGFDGQHYVIGAAGYSMRFFQEYEGNDDPQVVRLAKIPWFLRDTSLLHESITSTVDTWATPLVFAHKDRKQVAYGTLRIESSPEKETDSTIFESLFSESPPSGLFAGPQDIPAMYVRISAPKDPSLLETEAPWLQWAVSALYIMASTLRSNALQPPPERVELPDSAAEQLLQCSVAVVGGQHEYECANEVDGLTYREADGRKRYSLAPATYKVSFEAARDFLSSNHFSVEALEVVGEGATKVAYRLPGQFDGIVILVMHTDTDLNSEIQRIKKLERLGLSTVEVYSSVISIGGFHTLLERYIDGAILFKPTLESVDSPDNAALSDQLKKRMDVLSPEARENLKRDVQYFSDAFVEYIPSDFQFLVATDGHAYINDPGEFLKTEESCFHRLLDEILTYLDE